MIRRKRQLVRKLSAWASCWWQALSKMYLLIKDIFQIFMKNLIPYLQSPNVLEAHSFILFPQLPTKAHSTHQYHAINKASRHQDHKDQPLIPRTVPKKQSLIISRHLFCTKTRRPTRINYNFVWHENKSPPLYSLVVNTKRLGADASYSFC